MKYEPNNDIKTVIVTIHGIENENKNMRVLSRSLAEDTALREGHYTEIVYGKVLAIVNYIPVVRFQTSELVAARLAVLSYK